MSRIFMQDIQGPLVVGTGTVLGAAGRRKGRFPCPAGPELCQLSPDAPPFSADCPCGRVPRPL